MGNQIADLISLIAVLYFGYSVGFKDGEKGVMDAMKSDSSSPSSPLPEREEDSAPTAQPGGERTNDTTGQAEQP